MPKKKRSQRKHRPPLIAFLILVVLFGGTLIYILSRPYFTITKTEIKGAELFDASAIEEKLKIHLGQNLFFTNLSGTKKFIKGLNHIKYFNLYRIPPGKLSVRIKERVPFAVIIYEGGLVRRSPDERRDEGGQSLIDEEGVILGTTPSNQEQDLPIIRGIAASDIKNSRLQDKTLKSILTLLSSLKNSLPEKNFQLEFKNNYAEINLSVDDILQVKLGDASELDKKMQTFAHLLKVIEGKWQKVEYLNITVPSNPAVKYIN